MPTCREASLWLWCFVFAQLPSRFSVTVTAATAGQKCHVAALGHCKPRIAVQCHVSRMWSLEQPTLPSTVSCSLLASYDQPLRSNCHMTELPRYHQTEPLLLFAQSFAHDDDDEEDSGGDAERHGKQQCHENVEVDVGHGAGDM